MHKIVKTGKTLHIILAVATALYLTGHALLNNKKIQQKAAVHVVKIAKTALGTDVSAGSVQFAYPFGITIDDLTVYDLSDDTLAHVSSVSLRLKPFQLIRNRVSITSVRIHNPKVFLYKDSASALPNYSFLTNLGGNGGSPMTFRANSVLIRNGSVKYDIRDAGTTDSIFNPNHIGIDGLTASLSLKSISSDSIAFIVRKLSLTEQSGFKLSSAKGALTVGKGFTHLTGFMLSTPGSRFEIAELMAQAGLADRPQGIPDFETNLTASVTGSDFKAFVPQVSGMTEPMVMDLRCSGRNHIITVNSLHVFDLKKTLDIKSIGVILTGTDPFVEGCRDARIYGNFSERLPQWAERQLSGWGISIPGQCESLGDGAFSINLTSESGRLDAKLLVNCDAGILSGRISGIDGVFNGQVEGSDILFDAITGNKDLGRCNLTANAEVTRSDKGFTGTLGGNISSIIYKRYEYRDIAINGTIAPGITLLQMGFSDRNGKIAVDADIRKGAVPSYQVNLSADDMNLAAYHLTEKDSLTLSARMHARLEGNDIDRIQGKMTIDSLEYSDREGNWHMDNLTASIGNMNERNRVVSVFSDFMSISMVGDYNISSLPYSLSRISGDVLPSIGKMIADKLNADKNQRPNRFVIDAKLDNTEFVEHLFHYPVKLNHPANMMFSFNDVDSIYYGQVNVPSIDISGESLSQFLLTLNSTDDTCKSEISCQFGTEEKGKIDINTSFLAFDDMVRGEYSWTNADGDISGHVKSLSQFMKYDKSDWLESSTLIDRTDILIKGIPWHLDVTGISTDKGKIIISGLNVRNDDQYILADGVISADSSDVFRLSLHNIDLDNTLSGLHMNNIQLGGTASGDIAVAGIKSKPSFQGTFNIEDLRFMDAFYGQTSVNCKWDEERKRVAVTCNMNEPGVSSTAVTGFYVPMEKTVDINIDANHTDLYFLNLWTKSVFREINSRATGKLRIFGKLPDFDMEGEAVVENATFDLDAIHTPLFIRQDTLWFEPGKMLFTNVDIYDAEGHSGKMNCILNHDHFSDWRVNMGIDVDNMLVFRQPITEKGSFNATVYALGSMNLTFDQYKGLNIDVNAQTAPGTRLGFTFNSSNVADYNFITIVDRNNPATNEKTADANTGSDKSNEKGKSGSNFNLNLDIECTEDAMIDLSLSSLTGYMRGNGNVSVKYNPKDGPMLNGLYNLRYGQCSLSFEDLLRKNFTLMEDSYVRFNGAPMQTELNLKTYHNVNSVSIYDLDPSASSNNKVHVRCLMDITGHASDPQLSFDIDMPNGTSDEKAILASATSTEEQRNKQFMYLLAIGRFYTFDMAAMNSGLTPSAMESIVNATVSDQINNLLSQVMDNDKVSISSNLSASSYLSNDNTNLNNKELEGILEAHLLNNRLLINGNFGYRENTINNTSNFIGDFEFKYLLLPDKNGKGISIIGYNKANDKYFSKTTLTTQGVGLIFEKDF